MILVCLLLQNQNFSYSRLPNLLPVLLDGSSHERNTLIVHCNSLTSRMTLHAGEDARDTVSNIAMGISRYSEMWPPHYSSHSG